MTSAYSINLNFNNTIPVKTDFTFKQGDKGITLNLATTGLDPAGTTAHIVFKRSNGTSVEAELTGQTGPSYSYTILGNEFEIPGVVVADLKLYNGDTQRVSTASFIFLVTGDTMDGVGGGTGGYSDQLEQLSQEFAETLEEYQDAFGDVGAINPRGEYSALEEYTALDLVSYNGNSYLCREGCTGIAPTNTTYWQVFAVGGGAGLLPHVVITCTTGATVTLTKGGTTIAATETSTGTYEADVDEYGTWTISVSKGGLSATNTIIVDTVKIYSVIITFFNATITVNYPDNMRGQTFTCVNGAVTLTQTAPSNANTLSFSVTTTGTWTVTGAYSKTVVITTDGETQTITFYALKTFATATDQEIADMVSEADLGYLDLYDDAGWRVGQERTVSLDAIAASGTFDGVSWSVGEAQAAQNVTLVLMHRGLYELVTPVLDKNGNTRNTCSFIVGIKDSLSTMGYMNSTGTTSGTWDGCARRGWCNSGLRSAIPVILRSSFKQFKTITAETNAGSTNKTSQDYFALPAYKEVAGETGTANATESNALTQFAYYVADANRIKKVSGTAYWWWLRSPAASYDGYFLDIRDDGTRSGNTANNAYGISPFGCL